MIRAIETHYKGYRFRSRLEARWAVFFDTLGFRWEYEKEGFDIDGIWYLPDFWLADIGCYAEVKPQAFTLEEFQKAATIGCIFLDGMPDERFYYRGLPSALTDPSEYDDYLAGLKRSPNAVHWGWVELYHSLHKGRLWYDFGEGMEPYRCLALRNAVYAARSARFEHRASGS